MSQFYEIIKDPVKKRVLMISGSSSSSSLMPSPLCSWLVFVIHHSDIQLCKISHSSHEKGKILSRHFTCMTPCSWIKNRDQDSQSVTWTLIQQQTKGEDVKTKTAEGSSSSQGMKTKIGNVGNWHQRETKVTRRSWKILLRASRKGQPCRQDRHWGYHSCVTQGYR